MDVYKKSNSYQNGCRSHYTDRLRLAQEWVKYPNLRVRLLFLFYPSESTGMPLLIGTGLSRRNRSCE